ncbi:MAG: DnaJ domain-containing protein [Endozoicomonas sp.]|uniref:DnaJ domain-containing protein n=1 Tax=Endozoicomonas sp. TaxID=1892382 RepID=UPI003D9BE6E8
MTNSLSRLNPEQIHIIVSDIEKEVKSFIRTFEATAEEPSFKRLDLCSNEVLKALKKLGLPESSTVTSRDVYSQFRKLALVCHPDKTEEDNEEKFKELNKAKETLIRRLE